MSELQALSNSTELLEILACCLSSKLAVCHQCLLWRAAKPYVFVDAAPLYAILQSNSFCPQAEDSNVLLTSQQPSSNSEFDELAQQSNHPPAPVHPSAEVTAVSQQPAQSSDAESSHEPASESLPAQQTSPQAAVQSNDVVTISKFLSLSHHSPNSGHGFRIFCAVLSFLRPMHAQGSPVQCVRPSQLMLHRTGQISLQCNLQAPAIESELYTSPEELSSRSPSLPSDIFSLGVLLFELLNPIQDQQLRSSVLGDVRQRVLPPAFLEQHSSHAIAFLMALIHPDASKRPSVAQIISSNLLNMLRASFEASPEAAESLPLLQQQHLMAQQQRLAEEQAKHQHQLAEQTRHQRQLAQRSADAQALQQSQHHSPKAGVDSETLLDFLSIMRQTTVNAMEKTRHQLGLLDMDMREVNTRMLTVHCQQGNLDGQDLSELQQHSSAPSSLFSQPLELQHPASRKRQRSWDSGASECVDLTSAEQSQAESKRDKISHSCCNMERAFTELESKFFSRRERPAVHAGASSADLSDGSHVDLPGLAGLSDHLTDFSADLIDFSRYSELKVRMLLVCTVCPAAVLLKNSTYLLHEPSFKVGMLLARGSS